MLLYLSIFRREFLVQTTALYYTGWHPMASDAKRFHAVPNGRKDSRSSMLHPTAPPPTSGPLALGDATAQDDTADLVLRESVGKVLSEACSDV